MIFTDWFIINLVLQIILKYPLIVMMMRINLMQ